MSVLATALAVGCSSEDPAKPPVDDNQPPTVTFTFNKVAVSRSSDVTLTVAVDDPNGDTVTVHWEVSRGLLDAQDQGSTSMQWTTPTGVGTDTVTITASDGRGGQDTIEEYLEVGTRQADNISSSTTWDVSDSPYLISPATDKISILPGRSLTINAGVVVYVDKTAISIDVDGGHLVTSGTPSNPVVIAPNVPNPEAGFWIGLRGLGNQPTLDLDYTNITHAVNGVRTVGSAQLQINHCKIMVCSSAGILHESTGGLEVENSAITNNLKSGIQVKLLSSTPDFVVIRGDSIAVNGRFSDSVVYAEGEAGISLDFNDVSGGGVSVEISGNEISRNDFPGIRLITAVYPTITNNGIFGNELRKATNKIDIELIAPQSGEFPIGEINAKQNWWGFAYPALSDSTRIKDRIIDAEDNPLGDVRAKVLVTPWLAAPQ
jgi:parallel beta-helix repeat protein